MQDNKKQFEIDVSKIPDNTRLIESIPTAESLADKMNLPTIESLAAKLGAPIYTDEEYNALMEQFTLKPKENS